MNTTANVIVTEAELEALMSTPKPKLPRAVPVTPAVAAARKLEATYNAARRPQTNDALTFLMNRAR